MGCWIIENENENENEIGRAHGCDLSSCSDVSVLYGRKCNFVDF